MKHFIINDIQEALNYLKEHDENFELNMLKNNYKFTFTKKGVLIVDSTNYWNIRFKSWDMKNKGYLITKENANDVLVYSAEMDDIDMFKFLLECKELKEYVRHDYMFDSPFLTACIFNSRNVLNHMIFKLKIPQTKRISFHMNTDGFRLEGIDYARRMFEERRDMRRALKEIKKIKSVITPDAGISKSKFKL